MSFEDVLPSMRPRYNYEGIEQCIRMVDQEAERQEREESEGLSNPYIIMDIDEDSFIECFVNSGESIRRHSWELYDHASQSTLLKIYESAIHAVAGGAFETIFSAWTRKVDDTLILSTRASAVRGDTWTKKADISWTLIDPSGRPCKWPTFVGEVAWSEQRRKLLRDIEFWLNDSNGEVKIAITITIHARGRTTVSSNSEKEIQGIKLRFPAQKIKIIRKPAPNCPRINGQLKLQLHDIFLREKTGSEVDFVLTERDMERIARSVWAFQFNSFAEISPSS
ncbi:hypothetical protein N7517_001964 [Penicillium concentricum]|uniref:Uncharacterized protein n=1 Tax=Penicillium concentricum TaxID=293559 RepID=A0A9W9VJ22_9EURO|nr:uncharacterized protein N7517_001964 [Penicillium concentricum]KAJ5384053.1 hypothetical protein N7517_001964 [Penicillium concentricum]